MTAEATFRGTSTLAGSGSATTSHFGFAPTAAWYMRTIGDAWTEEFPDLTECMMWLAGEKEAAQAAKAQRKYETGDGPAEDVELRQYRCLRCNHVWYEDCDAPDYPDYCPGCGESLCRGGTQE